LIVKTKSLLSLSHQQAGFLMIALPLYPHTLADTLAT
jgi:hypothetical protein